ncbi:MAG: anaerobic ribonucleoside-triphosphate reductase activating protein [Clostridia bacterium]|nr:anaerobic ribonucleoside-triphosphate reductase activating protein [Clostridia bacterium]
MVIKGLQKLTLLDYPQKCAAVVFTAGCNLRCPFCHNSSLIPFDGVGEITEEEFFTFLKTRKNLLDGVVISGGEPLLQKDVESFIYNIKEMGFLVKLDTNGTNPKLLKSLVEKGLLDYVAMDIKNSPARYAQTVGLKTLDFAPIKESIDFLLTEPCDYEFRTTVVDQLFDEQSFIDIAALIKGAKRYYLQPFVDSDAVLFKGLSAPCDDKMNSYAQLLSKMLDFVQIRGK